MHRALSAFGPVVVVSALALAGCGGPITYTPRMTPRAPDADATIIADVHRDQSMTNLNVRVQHLAPPDRIQPGGSTYIVWSRHNQSVPWNRVGILAYNPSSREGTLQATAPETFFDLQITVENMLSPAAPSPNVVLIQRVGQAQ